MPPFLKPTSVYKDENARQNKPRLAPSRDWESTFDDWELPLIGSVGRGITKLRGMEPDWQSAPFDFAGPLDFPASIAAGWIPKKIAKEFGLRTGKADAERLAGLGYPKIAEVVATMSKKHPVVVGHTRGFDMMDPKASYYNPRHGAHYSKGDVEGGKSIVAAAGDKADEQLYDFARQFTGQTRFNPTSENQPIDRIFEMARHELGGHAVDDSIRDSVEVGRHIYDIDDPRYWMSIPEVRARAVAQNYRRDMGDLAYNKEAVGKFTPEGDLDFSKVGRIPYSHKVGRELRHGEAMGRNMNFPPPPASPKLHPTIWGQQVQDTLDHYYGLRPEFDPNSVSFKLSKPALLKPDMPDWYERMAVQYGLSRNKHR